MLKGTVARRRRARAINGARCKLCASAFPLFIFLFVVSRRPPRTLTVVFPPRTVVFPSLGGVLRRSSTFQCFSNREMMIVALGGARVVQLSFRKPSVLSRIRLSVIFYGERKSRFLSFLNNYFFEFVFCQHISRKYK